MIAAFWTQHMRSRTTLGVFCLVLLFPDRVFAAEAAGQAPRTYIDYATLSHRIRVEKFRAGNHSPGSETNQYFFKINLTALVDNAEEAKLGFEKRKKLRVEIGEFADIQASSLSQVPIDLKDKVGISKVLAGDEIRKIVSQMMAQFAVNEENIAVQVEVTLYRRKKKYYLLREEILVGSIKYFPIPMVSSEQKLREELRLNYEDKLGTFFTIVTDYNNI